MEPEGYLPPGTFIFQKAVDYPPEVSLNVTLAGQKATLQAIAADDKTVTKVEFWLDDQLIATDTSAPYATIVDLSNYPRKYAYLYAKAFDGTELVYDFPNKIKNAPRDETYQQRAYSNVVELGPEVILSGQPATRPTTNYAPVVDAGADMTITLPASLSLDGAVNDDGLPNPPGALTVQWTQVSGPAPVTFTDPAALTTTATFTEAGTYVLRLTASDGSLSSRDDVTIIANPAPATNQPPVVDSGQDQQATLNSPATVSLNGSVSDDGLPNPPGALTVLWSQLNGPAPVTFTDPTALVTTATFTEAGIYVLRLSADDGNLSSRDDLTITVNPAPAGDSLTISGLTVASGQTYEVVDSGLASGALVYIDRSYTYKDIPTILQGATYIRTANNDKKASREDFLSFSVNQEVTVYVAYDHRASSLPNWLAGWTDTGERVENTDVALNLFARDFASGTITLGGNQAAGAAGADSNYTIMVVGN